MISSYYDDYFIEKFMANQNLGLLDYFAFQ